MFEFNPSGLHKDIPLTATIALSLQKNRTSNLSAARVDTHAHDLQLTAGPQGELLCGQCLQMIVYRFHWLSFLRLSGDHDP